MWGKRQGIYGGKRSSGNKAPEVNAVCSLKSPSVSSPLNDFNAANKKIQLDGSHKTACKGTHGFWYANGKRK
uniref:Uncharacterized protein n=1 Tax=Cucumis sativus TaxID=3659 RepID=A0A0A0LSX1_CUCSA